jgi:hypothetical protein
MWREGLFRAVVVFLLVWERDATAQTAPSLDARTWKPSIDPDANLVLEAPTTPGPWRWNLAAWAQYAHEPVVLRGDGAPHPVTHLVGADLVAGIGLGTRAAVGVDVPAYVWQDGTTPLPQDVVKGGAVPTSGIGDVTLLSKITLVSDDRMGTHSGFGLAALGGVSLPAGSHESFMGDGDVTASLRLLAGYAIGPATARASLGYSLRTRAHAWPDGGPTYGDSIPWSAGVTLRPKAFAPSLDHDDRQVWELAVHGAVASRPVTPFVGSGVVALSPALLALDDRVALGHYQDTYLTVGAEVGLDQATGVPALRAVVGLGWAPRSHDQDNDGVPDAEDQCPDLPEDRDGIQDEDGCPEDDADSDGIPDAQDACPLVPGAASPDPKRNGCPDRAEEKK